MGRIRNALKALFGGDATGSALASSTPYGTLPRRGTRELLQAYKRHPWLRTVVQRISSDVASTPWRLYAPAKPGAPEAKALVRGVQRANGRIRRGLIDAKLKAGDLVEVTDHPALDLLHAMNPALRGVASMQVTQAYLDVKGEAFWVTERNGLGHVVEAWPIPPHWVIQTPSIGLPGFRISAGGWNTTLGQDGLVWFKQADLENPYGRGVGLAEALGDEIDIDEQAARHVKSWFRNRALPEAFIAVENITKAEAERFAEDIAARHQGPDRAHGIHVTNGKATVQMLAQTFKDQQLAELRGMQRDTCLQVFNFPPELVGLLENSNRATIDAAYFLYATGVLCPRLDFMASSLQPLVAEWDDRLLLDYVSPVPEDKEFELKVLQAAPWSASKNEWRALRGATPVDDGDVFPPMPTSGLSAMPDDGASFAADPPWAKSLRRPLRRSIDAGDVHSALEELRPDRLTSELDPVWQERLAEWGARVLGELGSGASFDMRNPLIKAHLHALGADKVVGVTDTTRAALQDSLIDGVQAGEGIDELKKRVQDVFDIADDSRAETIARTEVMSSSNFANLQAFQQSGVVDGKEWLAVEDENTREDHSALDGSVVGLSEPFVAPSGAAAQHPGGFGVAEEDINCRCSVLPMVKDPEPTGDGKSARARVVKLSREDHRVKVEEDRRPWERAAKAALHRGFATQRDDVLRALERLAS